MAGEWHTGGSSLKKVYLMSELHVTAWKPFDWSSSHWWALCPFELSRAERKVGEVFEPVYTRIWSAELLSFRLPKSLSVRTVPAARSLWAVYVRCDS